VKRTRLLLHGDIDIDCSASRLLYEWVIRQRGNNAVGKYGMGVARRWLSSMGMQLDRHYAFITNGVRPSPPDFFDHSTGIPYEVKTGRHSLNNRSMGQITAYEHAIKTRQATLVAYLNVAFEGRMGLAPRYREELVKRGFRLLILR